MTEAELVDHYREILREIIEDEHVSEVMGERWVNLIKRSLRRSSGAIKLTPTEPLPAWLGTAFDSDSDE